MINGFTVVFLMLLPIVCLVTYRRTDGFCMYTVCKVILQECMNALVMVQHMYARVPSLFWYACSSVSEWSNTCFTHAETHMVWSRSGSSGRLSNSCLFCARLSARVRIECVWKKIPVKCFLKAVLRVF